MQLLWDAELERQINDGNLIIEGLPDAEDSIQAASVDLHIGRLYRPGPFESEDPPSVDGLWLGPGQTVVVSTRERLKLPADMAAFGFPPTYISDKAILMTNPGHIDPGFEGHLCFTLINMGKYSYYLSTGQVVATLLFVRLSTDVTRSYPDRGHKPSSPHPSRETLARLGEEFLDVRSRAAEEARKKVLELEGLWKFAVPIVVAIVAAIGSFWVGRLEASVELQSLRTEFESTRNQMALIERVETLESILVGLRANEPGQGAQVD